jgi:hypothetical protein
MREIAGECAPGYPNCFAPSPYTLEGVYSHISEFAMSLHRVVHRHGTPFSFVSGHCVLPAGVQVDGLALLRVSLVYSDGGTASEVVDRDCKVREGTPGS